MLLNSSSRRQLSERAQSSAREQDGGTLCFVVAKTKRKVPHPYSAAEETAASLTGIRDDEGNFVSREFPGSASSRFTSSGFLSRRRSALRNSDIARNDKIATGF